MRKLLPIIDKIVDAIMWVAIAVCIFFIILGKYSADELLMLSSIAVMSVLSTMWFIYMLWREFYDWEVRHGYRK